MRYDLLSRESSTPLKVSTRAVIAPEMVDAKEEIPQIDTIIWQPNPFLGIFRSGDFALIPRQSSLAILEVKYRLN